MSSDGLRALGQHVAEQEDILLDLAERSETTRRNLAELVAQRPAPARPWRTLGAVAAAAIVGAGAALFVSRSIPLQDESLSFTVGETARPGVLRAWESAPPDSRLPIHFSDGTSMRLEPDARARVVRLAPSGADVVIGSGRALVEVVPNEHGNWTVRTGPFVVEVKGTRFEVGWSPQTDEFSLKLHEGRVLVTGCRFGKGRMVEAGQELHASCRAPGHAAAPAPRVPVVSDVPAGGEKPTQQVPAAKHPSKLTSWRTLAHEGHYLRAYELAAQAGFEAECERCSAEDALVLADAARLSGRTQHAQHAYSSVRRRFPGSGAAARAAFALGRSALQAGDAGGAVRWFETCRSEQPGGPLSAAALDRLLEASLRLGDPSRARAAARKYLTEYPAGPHAKDARNILGLAEPTRQP